MKNEILFKKRSLFKRFILYRLTMLSLMIIYTFFFSITFAQEKKMSIEIKDRPLSEILNMIELKTGYSFLVRSNDVDLKQMYTVEAKNKSVEEILSKLFKNTDINYKIEGKNVSVFIPKRAQNSDTNQEKTETINGFVVDENSTPIIGASIIIENTHDGTITNVDGKFSLKAPTDSKLIVSYIGYRAEKISINGKKSIDITLFEDSRKLDEVVVIGYGTARKSDLIGSVASIKANELAISKPTMDQALIGRAAGVEIRQQTGAPGQSATIRIRGVNSIYSATGPLWVVDGYPVSSEDNTINPDDIESIEILKDAASAAIYGSRAAGGVIMVTTKRGTKDKPKVELSFQHSSQELAKKLKMFDALEYASFNRDGYNNAYFDQLRAGKKYTDANGNVDILSCWNHSRKDDELIRYNTIGTTAYNPSWYVAANPYNSNTDWQNEVFNSAPMDRVSISVTGGSTGSKFMFSASYLNQEGIIAPSGSKTLTARLNVDFDVTKKISFAVNSSMSYSVRKDVNTDGNPNSGAIIATALMATPYAPAYRNDGITNQDGSNYFPDLGYVIGHTVRNVGSYAITGDDSSKGIQNPLIVSHGIKDNFITNRYNINAVLSYKIIEGLTAKVNAGTQFLNQIEDYYRPGWFGNGTYPGGDYIQGHLVSAENNRDYNMDWLVEGTLNYNKKIGKGELNAVAGYSAQEKNYFNLDASGNLYSDDRIPYISGVSVGSNASIMDGRTAQTDVISWSMLSAFGRVIYNYDKRYNISLTLRSDGSSRFGYEKRWGYFPSVSAGWTFSNEQFFKPLADVVTGKIRASWGISGNNNIGNYSYYVGTTTTNYPFNGSITGNTGLYENGFGDAGIHWEKTAQTNIGLDLTFLNGKLNLIGNYYSSIASDLLYKQYVGPYTNSTSVQTNLVGARVYNTGFDVQVDANIIQNKDWKWNLGFNISSNKNDVEGILTRINTYMKSTYLTNITDNGLPISSFYGMVSDGLINKADFALIQQDANNWNPTTGKYDKLSGTYTRQGPAVYTPDYDKLYIGDVKWKDVNGDGVITPDDRKVIGSPFPDFTYGINSSLSYKNFRLSATLVGQQGGQVINFLRDYYTGNLEGGVNQQYELAINRSNYDPTTDTDTGDGVTTRANRYQTINLKNQFSTRSMEDATFLRCSNLTLGYTLPTKLSKALTFSRLYIYASADNLFTITKYTGYNPEVSTGATTIQQGIDFGTYPLARTYNLGINITL